ncbi:biliverdin-producing heme oxygenase [Pigmentibacter sp. JX0631]|uniref:biliverdin-producing heme oxygenase n=1 Tax=Pigmentibacter sp. JX0631 TaxID=2976982 RepID=UPI0024687EB3|nr:biliverdin-producing heme oxygenase [Pigmentibacter sp. JX0631]WGL60710.1 biliverdin-producing heme oxygenase [Pigmentibacter sp. JX0631]
MDKKIYSVLNEKSIRELLKEQTKDYHNSVENLNYLSKDSISKIDYINFLKIFYRVIDPIEQLYIIKFKSEIDNYFQPSFKTDLILSDLKNLAVDLKQIKKTEFLPKIESKYEMVGVLYVLEGSVLGSAMLYNKLIALFGEEFRDKLNYLYGYGKDNFVKWKQFLKFLDEFKIIDDSSKLELIEAAKNMFNCFANEFRVS